MITYRLRTLAEMTVFERDMQYHFGPGSLFLTLYSPPSHVGIVRMNQTTRCRLGIPRMSRRM
jgi:hypothetical protein